MTEQASRWKFTSVKVTVDGNSQHVRKFTAGERKAFALKSKEIKAGKFDANDLPMFIVSLASVEPTLTAEEAEGMPPDLLDACVQKIMELSGFKDDDEGGDEKKELTPPSTSSSQTTT